MRTEKSIKNALVAIISNIVLIIIGFISQYVFKNTLGQDYLGLNGLFTSIVSMLGIVELGLGTALIYHLYKPVAENDIEKVKALMHFYRTSYRIIAGIIIIAGMILMPFLKFFIDTTLDLNFHYIFGLFVIESAFSYLLSYKRSILYANQENYIVNIIHILYVLSMNIVQILILIYTKNYLLYLWIKIIFRIIENIAVTIVANKRYPYINVSSNNRIDNNTRNDIIIKVKGLFIHKIGSYLVLGTDNIIISKYLTLAVVGMYTSYSMITSGIKNFFSQIFYSITASVGNLLVLDKNKAYDVYKDMLFMNFWLSGICSISFYIISKPFVTLWLGNDFVLTKSAVAALMVNLYFDTYGYTIGAFKSAAGIFHEDRWIPAFQSLINITVSIIMVQICGLAGVIIGTIVSQMLLYLYSYPVLVYKKLFNKNTKDFFLETIKYFSVYILTFLVTLIITRVATIHIIILQLLINALVCLIIPNLLFFLFFHSTSEFDYFKRLIINKLSILQNKKRLNLKK